MKVLCPCKLMRAGEQANQDNPCWQKPQVGYGAHDGARKAPCAAVALPPPPGTAYLREVALDMRAEISEAQQLGGGLGGAPSRKAGQAFHKLHCAERGDCSNAVQSARKRKRGQTACSEGFRGPGKCTGRVRRSARSADPTPFLALHLCDLRRRWHSWTPPTAPS